jgi:RHS repeat-associated protein
MIHFSSLSIFHRLAIAVLLSALVSVSARAQMGNDNPTGISGAFNGNVTTAGSYDPYTGNATRSVTDITVAGAVGAYPLAFTRTMNTRYTPGAGTWEMGTAGSWRHNYQWNIDSFTFQSNAPDKWTVMPAVYTVNYPDGRRVSFSSMAGDSMMRAGRGVSDRFQKPNSDYDDCYLLLPDGGKIWFTVQIQRFGDDFGPVTISCDYTFMGIIDPYGQTTTVSYPADGSMTITEPAGRWLKLFYTTTPWMGDTVLVGLQASDGRSVTYNYGGYQPAGSAMYSYLGNVQYRDTSGNVFATAIYFYQPGNVDPNGRPLISGCIDPMYSGPMWSIGYTFVPGSSGGVYGQLQSENYLDPATGGIGVAVSTLSAAGDSRTETRGDTPSRTFNYIGGKMSSYTDFKGQTSYISYDGNGFTNGFTDARGNTTTTSREGIIGAASVRTHPDQSTQGYAYWYRDGGPYYLQIRGDERGHNTYFTRDPNNFQLTRIDYPDYPNGPYETFAYNGFGQVYSHRMTSGGVETRYFDGRGMMWASSNPDGTTYYYYDGLDRLEHVTDARSNTTFFQYNPRGQVTRVTHPDGSYVQYGYDNHGDRTSVTDELGHTTSYAYDDYKRVVYVTNPLNQTTSYVYAQDWAIAYNQTTSNPKGAFSPIGRQVHYAYDENWQRTIMRVPPTSDPHSDSNDAWTFYGYDAAGNLLAVRDPRGYQTTFGYDNRNRRTSATDALNEATTWQYDATSNMTRETRPDQSYRRAEYDSMNRVIDSYGFAGEHTHYDRDLAGNVHQLVDAKGAGYVFYYDAMNRKASAWYPPDATNSTRYDAWYRDAVGNVYRHDSPAGNVQIFEYDNRNRMYHSYWWGNAGPDTTIGYDVASRMISAVTNGGETSIGFGYDDANRKIWEDQTLSGYPTRRVNTPADADGNRTSLDVANYYHIDYGFNQRNQLSAIGGFANFHYDANGNMTNREGVWGYTNETNFAYDELSRVTQTELGANGWIYARSHYQYDSLSRQAATWRDEQSSKGETFWYTADNQLAVVEYNADQVWTGNPQNWNRWVGYTLTADTLNRQSVNDNGTVTGYTPDGMNQYTTVGSQGIGYDGNFNLNSWGGATVSYDAQNEMTSLNNGNTAQFTYDGLGRCVRRTINGVPRLFTYDGWKPMLEWDQWGNFLAWNVYGAGSDEILARGDSTYGALIYKQDHHGNVVGLLDGAGNVIEKYTYDAFGQPTVTDYWGNVRGSTSWYGNRFMFQGREWIAELGIYDFRNRMYHPALGRFLQPDPLGFGGGDANLFRYCGGDPVNCSDPDGTTVRFVGDTGAINTAINYLNGSATFAGIFASLQNSLQTYTIKTDYSFGNGSFTPNADGNGGVIRWNPAFGLWVTSAEGIQSAAMILAHELAGHAEDWDSNPLKYQSDSHTPAGVYDNMEEYAAVQIETRIADELEEAKRQDHGGNFEPMSSPTASVQYDPNYTRYFLMGVSQFGWGWGYGSGLNDGSHGGASYDAVMSTLLQTLTGIPGGGGLPGEGCHPVSQELE